MVKFEKEKFHSDYVYIKKITQNYIYILSDLEGNLYNKNNAIKGTYQGYKISKVKIHQTNFFNYIKHNSLREFHGNGRLGCISYYDGKVINIEIQRINFATGRFESSGSWKSTFESVINKTNEIVPNNSQPYIDGKEIFWVINDNYHPVTEDNCFVLKEVNYLDISRIGVQITKNQNNNSKKIESKTKTEIKPISFIGLPKNRKLKDIKKINFNSISYVNIEQEKEKSSVAFVKSGVVICYNPYFGVNNDYEVYSPVLRRNDNSKSKKAKNEIMDIYNIIDSKNNKLFLNLNFVLKSAQIIGELYGYDETDFLKIPDIIQQTGVICLHKIEEDSRKTYPVNLNKWDCFAWLFKYIYLEKDLYKILDLNKLFKYTMNYGIISQEKISNVFKEGKSDKDIQKYNIKNIKHNIEKESLSLV